MSSCHPEMQCFHGVVKAAGRFSSFDCDACQTLAAQLGCEPAPHPEHYLFPTDPKDDPSKWWERYLLKDAGQRNDEIERFAKDWEAKGHPEVAEALRKSKCEVVKK